jgi:hypothetical protein
MLALNSRLAAWASIAPLRFSNAGMKRSENGETCESVSAG